MTFLKFMTMHLGKKLTILALGFGLMSLANTADALEERNVLNVPQRDYVESVGKSLKDYTMGGVHATTGTPRNSCLGNLVYDANQRFPKAEVVVNYTRIPVYSVSGSSESCFGTVLVPK